jgi:hypothetical protein
MTEEEIMFVSGKQEVKGKGQARVKSWRKIVSRGVMLMERERREGRRTIDRERGREVCQCVRGGGGGGGEREREKWILRVLSSGRELTVGAFLLGSS